MTPAAKSKAANYGLLAGVLQFISGSLLLCDCPGWFVCAAIAAAVPAILGTRVVRIAGISLCIASIITAVVQYRREQDRALRRQQLEATSAVEVSSRLHRSQ